MKNLCKSFALVIISSSRIKVIIQLIFKRRCTIDISCIRWEAIPSSYSTWKKEIIIKLRLALTV